MGLISGTPMYPQGLVLAGLAVVNADALTKKTLYTVAASTVVNGAKVECISATSTDGTARVFNLFVNDAGTDFQVGTVNIPANAGTDAAITPAVSVLETNAMLPWVRKDSDGRGYIYLEPGDILKVSAQVAVTAAKEIDFLAQIGLF